MKKIIIICLLFLITGCASKSINVSTIVEEETNILIGINYPVTNIMALDNRIKNYIDTEYKNFKNDYQNIKSLNNKSELNIDYEYQNISDEFINITIKTFIDSNMLAHPTNYLKTFIYNTKTGKFMDLSSIITEKELRRITPIIKDKLFKQYKDCILMDQFISKITPSFINYELVTFDDTYLTIHFNPYFITSGNCNIISISIPLKDLNLKIKLNKQNSVPNEKVNATITKTIDPSKPVIALTFDDGPSKYTKDIINLLNKYKANATFFVLGNKVKLYNDTLKFSLISGNELGNHSYNHKWLTRLSNDNLKYQINTTQNIIKEYTGYTPIYLRPTYGSSSARLEKNTDLEIVLWNVDTLDWKLKKKEDIARKAIKGAKDGKIILMHDTYKRTYEALKIILPELTKQGYQFVTISELKETMLLRSISNG